MIPSVLLWGWVTSLKVSILKGKVVKSLIDILKMLLLWCWEVQLAIVMRVFTQKFVQIGPGRSRFVAILFRKEIWFHSLNWILVEDIKIRASWSIDKSITKHLEIRILKGHLAWLVWETSTRLSENWGRTTSFWIVILLPTITWRRLIANR